MIEKIPGKKNGWKFDQLTNEEWKSVASYAMKNGGVRCLIINDKTSKLFGVGLTGRNIITVNNNVPDNELYFNHYC